MGEEIPDVWRRRRLRRLVGGSGVQLKLVSFLIN